MAARPRFCSTHFQELHQNTAFCRKKHASYEQNREFFLRHWRLIQLEHPGLRPREDQHGGSAALVLGVPRSHPGQRSGQRPGDAVPKLAEFEDGGPIANTWFCFY